MNVAAITSAAPPVQHQLTRALARRARARRLQDQQQRQRDQQAGQRDQPPRTSLGAGRRLPVSHDEPATHAKEPAGYWLPYVLPHSFGPYGLDHPAGPAGLVTPRTATRSAGPGTVG